MLEKIQIEWRGEKQSCCVLEFGSLMAPAAKVTGFYREGNDWYVTLFLLICFYLNWGSIRNNPFTFEGRCNATQMPPSPNPTCGLRRVRCCCVVPVFISFDMFLLEPRIYWKQPLYFQKVGVRLRTPHPQILLVDYTGYVVVPALISFDMLSLERGSIGNDVSTFTR